MMRGLQRRIARLAQHAGGAICPACGHNPGAPVVFTIDTDSTHAEGRASAEYCPRCGAVSWFTIVFDRQGAADAER